MRSSALLLAVILAASLPASATRGDESGKVVDDWVDEINKDINDLVRQARSQVLEPDKSADDTIRGIGSAAPGAGSALQGGGSVPDSTAGCNAAMANQQQAQGAAAPWDGQRYSAEGSHNKAKNALSSLKSKIQEIQRKVDQADQLLGSAEGDLRDVSGVHPIARQAQLAALAGGTEQRYGFADGDTRKIRGKFDKLKKRWEKFKSDLESGRIAKFDRDTDQYVNKGGDFVRDANQLIGQSQACQAGRSQSLFSSNSAPINQRGSELSGSEVQTSDAESALSDAQKPD